MLQNTKLFENLINVNRSFAERLVNAIKKIAANLRNFFKENPLEAKTEYGQALLEAMNKVENRVQELWDEAVAQGIRAENKESGSVKSKDRENYYDFSKSFKEQIKDFKNGVFPKGDTLIVRDTPKVFQKIGLNPLPMTYTQSHLKEALANEDGDHLGEIKLRQLPKALENPIAIIDSTSQPGRLVAIIELPDDVRKSIVAVEIDGMGKINGNTIDSNAIVSAHERLNAISKLLSSAFINQALGNGGVYFWNKEKATQLMDRIGVQFPKVDINDGFVKSISNPDSNVKKKIDDITLTKQFIRWFGDWQNKPKSASKVVDKDGKPQRIM